jgi:HK97 family phage major capsid protein
MANTTALNSTLTQDQVERLLIMPLAQESTYLSVGFPVFTSNGEPIKVPSLSSMGTPTYVSEGSAIPEVSASTSEVELLPSSVKAIKTITRMSNELVRQSVVAVESAFSMKMTSDVARILDAALWDGDGTGGAPTGICNFSGITSAGTAAGTVSVDDLYDMQQAAMDTYVMPGNMTWAMSPTNFTRIRKLADSTDQKFLTPSLAAGAPATLLGSPYVVTTHMPNDQILLFDRSQVAVGLDSRASIAILDQTYADYDEVAIRVTARYDTQPLNAEAVVSLSGITA